MAFCDVCGNFDDFLSFEKKDENDPDYQPDLYYYWRDAFPDVDCMCEICFDIANFSKKIIWADH